MMNAYPRWSIVAAPLLAALGCSDPVPPPAQAAVTLSVTQPVVHVDQMTCPVVHEYQVGANDPKTNKPAPPSSVDPGQSVISGQSGAKISCSVKGGGGTFTFSGTVSAVTTEGQAISVQFTNGTVTNGAGTADVSVYTPDLSANFDSTASCTIQVLQNQVKGGSIWATFSCPSIASPPSGLCGIGSNSTIVFENCDGS